MQRPLALLGLLMLGHIASGAPQLQLCKFTGKGSVIGPSSPPVAASYVAFPGRCDPGRNCIGWSVISKGLAQTSSASVLLRQTRGSKPNAAPIPILELAAGNSGLMQPMDAPSTLVDAQTLLNLEFTDGDMASVNVPLTFMWTGSTAREASPNNAADLMLLVPQQQLPYTTFNKQPFVVQIEGIGTKPSRGAFKPVKPLNIGGKQTWRVYVPKNTTSILHVWARVLPGPQAKSSSSNSNSSSSNTANGL